MKKEEAVKAARDFAANQGRDPERCKILITRQGPQWRVDFFSTAEKPSPGDFFSVYLDDLSGENARLVPGK